MSLNFEKRTTRKVDHVNVLEYVRISITVIN